MGFIYSIKNNVNGREYIGQTRAKKVEKRWSEHRRNPQGILKYAFAKWGLQNFTFSIVVEIPDEELNPREVLEIKERCTLVPKGYNIREGGDASPIHPHTRLKISEAAKLRFANRVKKVPTQEHIMKCRRKFYENHRERIKARQRDYNKKYRGAILTRQRERRRNASPEKKMRMMEKMRIWRLNNPRPPRVLTPEQKKRYREASKEAIARGEAKRKEKRKNRTPEEIERDNKARAEKRTPEKEEARRQRRKELEASRTLEEKAERLRKQKEVETEEQKERRRAQARERWANRTPEQIEKERERGRRRYEERKNKKLQESNGRLQGNPGGDALPSLVVDRDEKRRGAPEETREGQTGP